MATADIEFRKECYSGSVNVERIPESLRLMFKEYERDCEQPDLRLLDQIEDQIGTIRSSLVFDDGCEAHVKDPDLPQGRHGFFQSGRAGMLSGRR